MMATERASTDVLIVDDDELTRDALRFVLEEEGFSVATAANGREALNYLRRTGHPHLVLLDLMMPVMNGWEFRTQQKRDPDLTGIPVVVASAAGNIQEEVSLIGAEGCLQKPIDADKLVEVVRAYCVTK